MARIFEPGLAFSLHTNIGFAVGVATHDIPRHGSLVWMAEPVFPAPPTLERVGEIDAWRWPVFFPLDHAIRTDQASVLGVIALPPELEAFPQLRASQGPGRWVLVHFRDGKPRSGGVTDDPTLPIDMVVNDTALRNLIATGYRPEDDWVGPRRVRNQQAGTDGG